MIAFKRIYFKSLFRVPNSAPYLSIQHKINSESFKFCLFFSDLEEGDLPLPAAPGSDSQQAALNYSTLANAVASANGPSQDPSISSTETLLRNIQGLLKVAADNARQQERQINYEKGTNSNMVYLLSLAQYYMYLAATQKC